MFVKPAGCIVLRWLRPAISVHLSADNGGSSIEAVILIAAFERWF
jgi:hypothetical protein